MGFLAGSNIKESAFNAGDLGLNPGLGRSPRGGQCNPLQYSCLENPNGQRILVGYIESMGLQRVEHNWVNKHSTSQHMEAEHIMLWGESDKGKYCIISLICGIQPSQTHKKKESKLVVTKAWVLGNGLDIVWEYKFATSSK